MKKSHMSFIVFMFSLFFCNSLSFAANNDWPNINGTVSYNGTPVCAMVLANGQYMFTCSGDGSFNVDVPLDGNGQITVYTFCSGLSPWKQIIYPEDGIDMQIELQASDGGQGMDVSYDLQGIDSKWIRVTGTVTYNGSPVCAMALANGQYMFTCSGDGSFSLDVPLDSNGEITLYCFCSGLPPYKYVFTSVEISPILTLIEELEAKITILSDLYADGIPTLDELQNQLRPFMADTYLDNGYDADETLALWATGDAGPPLGFEILGISIYRNMRTQNFTVGDTPVEIDEKGGNYAGVWATIRIRVGDQTGDIITSYVQKDQGGEWKMAGNQYPFKEGFNINAQADRLIDSSGTEIDSGLDVVIHDVGNLAQTNFGIIGAVIMNEALPTIGQTDCHGLIVERPEDIITQYEIINAPASAGGSVYCEKCGLNIDAITDMEFVYIGYDDVGDPQLVWIALLTSKPIKESILAVNQSQYFPVVNAVADKFTSSQFNVSDLQDSVKINFAPVPNYSIENVRLSWGSSGENIIMHIENPNEKDPSWRSATFDTSSPSIWPPTSAWVSVSYEGDLGREFSSYYSLDLQ